MLKRLFLLLAFVAGAASAQGPAVPDYSQLKEALPKDEPNKIEVVEFFWYGCSHCYALEPFIEPWSKKLPSDVSFRRVPAMFNMNWAQAGRVYYTLEAMGLLETLHGKLFNAIHQDRLRINDETQLNDWLSRNNVDAQKFAAVSKSFRVESKLKQAQALTQGAQPQLNGVPALLVDGRYLVSAEVGSQKRMLEIVDALIAKQRNAAGAKGTTATAPSAAPAK